MKVLLTRVLMLLTLSVASVSCAVDPSPPAATPLATPSLRVTDSVTLAGALTDELIATQNDTVLVIDLRTKEEGAEVEARQMSAANINYVNIPVGRAALDRKTVDRFSKLIRDNSHQKIVVHCSSGNRAGLMWAAHLINQGAGVTEAEGLVAPIVTKEPARQAIVEYAGRQK